MRNRFLTLPLLVGLVLVAANCSDDDAAAKAGNGTTPPGAAPPGTPGGPTPGPGDGSSSGVPDNPGVPVNYTCTADIHVSPTGDDANPGSDAAKPMKTIAAAAKKAKAGDCVKVHEGTYVETQTISFSTDGTKDAPIVVWSVDGKLKAVIDAGSNDGPTVLIQTDFGIIDGFDFKNKSAASEEQLIHIDGLNKGKGNGSAIRNCKLTGGFDTLKLNEGSTGVTIEGNEISGDFQHLPVSLTGANSLVFRSNYGHDWHLDGDGAIQIKGGTHDAVFDGNRFENVDTAAGTIALGDGCGSTCDQDPEHYAGVRLRAINNVLINCGRGFDIQGCKDCAVLSNTIIDSGKANVVLKITSADTNGNTKTSTGTRIMNNIIANKNGDLGSVIQINSGNDTGLSMDYNLVWNGSGSVEWGDGHPGGADSHSITGQDPKLKADFGLDTGSPAIGKGTNLIGDVPLDYAKKARPATAAFDIGAVQSN